MGARLGIALLALTLAFAGRAAAAPDSLWSGRYVVRSGDSLTAIALRYHVSYLRLAHVNGLNWRKPLLIGVVLHVPEGAAAAPARWAGVYVVKPGDTLSGIALRYHVTLGQLASANGMDANGVLLIGKRLAIPALAGSALDLSRVSQANPYRRGAVGYDVSYPNCNAPPPAVQEFAVLGLNWGRPFTANPCFARQWETALRPRSVYVNVAYHSVLFRHITPDCLALGREQPFRPAAQRAFAVGCSAAVAALRLLGPIVPLAIWLDVEPGNTWSSRTALNVATLKGMLTHLLEQPSHPPVGVYSNAAFWDRITGNWRGLSVPEWVATGDVPDPAACPAPFSGGPVWIVQRVVGGRDVDRVC